MLQVCAKRAIAMVIFSRIGMAMPAMCEGVMCSADCVLQCLLQQQVYSMLRNVRCIVIWHVKVLSVLSLLLLVLLLLLFLMLLSLLLLLWLGCSVPSSGHGSVG